jgi:hypothetical protein
MAMARPETNAFAVPSLHRARIGTEVYFPRGWPQSDPERSSRIGLDLLEIHVPGIQAR